MIVVTVIIAALLAMSVVALLIVNSRHNKAIDATRDEIAQLTARNAQCEERLKVSGEELAALTAKDETRLKEVASSLAESEKNLEAERLKVADLRAECARLEERLRIYDDEQAARDAREEARFKAIASDIMNTNAAMLNQQHETRLNTILNPLKENIEQFKRSVNDCYSTEARERFALMKSIEELIKTNTSIGQEARELTRALRGDSKVQGDWGEMILESILEKSGLRRDEEYFVQVSTGDDGRALRNDAGHLLRPDVLVKYPRSKRCVVIDSKVSLTAYVDYVNAEDDEARDEAAARHIRSVKSHINELARKSYQDFVGDGEAEFVMMFIPNEGAYIAAMQSAPSLWQDAYNERVLIVSPTHLVSALKLISQLWSNDRRQRNAEEIATEAGRLYDKFAGFLTDMEAVSKGINNSRKACDEAMKKLSEGNGNVISKIENLRKLGAKVKSTKTLPGTSEGEE